MKPRAAMLTFVVAILSFVLPASAQTNAANAPVLYRLDAGSTYQSGCFPPCMCPVLNTAGTAGTMTLSRIVNDGQWAVYRISNINWHVPFGDGLRVTGSGEYRVGTIGPINVLQNRLTLDLKVGDQPVQHFDSGQVFAAAAFPKLDITISINGMFCHDTVFDVVASPVPANQIQRFGLYESQFIEGCYNPCDCAIFYRPLIGTYDLVKLPRTSNTGPEISAIINVKWTILPFPAPNSGNVGSITLVTGDGIYSCEPISADRRLILDLNVGNNTPERYDSGHFITNVPVCGQPINIDVANNAFTCFNRVFAVRSFPLNNLTAPAALLAPEMSPIGAK